MGCQPRSPRAARPMPGRSEVLSHEAPKLPNNIHQRPKAEPKGSAGDHSPRTWEAVGSIPNTTHTHTCTHMCTCQHTLLRLSSERNELVVPFQAPGISSLTKTTGQVPEAFLKRESCVLGTTGEHSRIMLGTELGNLAAFQMPEPGMVTEK